MTESLSERRMVENEVIFRARNEKIQRGLDELKEIAKEDHQESLLLSDHTVLQFYCECSDENCLKRVTVELDTYAEIHKKRNQFTILPDHAVDAIEKVIFESPAYWVVGKFELPPETAPGLQSTPVDNS